VNSVDYRSVITRTLQSCGGFLEQRNPWIVSVALVLIMFLKDGIGFFYVFDPATVSAEFPIPLDGPDASSFGWPLIVWALQLETYRGLWLIPLVIIVVSALLLTPLLARRFDRPTAYAISTVLLLGPIPMSLLSHLGRHDFLVVIGGVALVLSLTRPVLAGVAALVMSAGNPEQAMVATVLLLLAVQLTQRRSFVRASLAAAISAGSYWLFASMLLTMSGGSSRIGTLSSVIPDASRIALSNLPVLLWTTYGLSLFAVIVMLLSTPGWKRLALLAVMIVPVALYFLGDQTRIGIAVATPLMVFATIAVLHNIMPRLSASARQTTLGATALGAVFIPSIHILYAGGVWEPYTFLVQLTA